MQNMDDVPMKIALEEAKLADAEDEVPVGAVIVKNGVVIARAHNLTEQSQNPLAHAEINAITLACQALQNKRLSDCELYVTMEPCPMCAGAIRHARIKKVVYAAKDATAGAFGSVLNLNHYPMAVPKPELQEGPYRNESTVLLRSFFRRKRSQ